jgi:hypothetical protein
VDPEPRRAAAFEANTKAPNDHGTLPNAAFTAILFLIGVLAWLRKQFCDPSESSAVTRSDAKFPKNFLATGTSSVPTLSCAQQIPLVSFAVTVTQPTSVPAILSHTRATQSITLPLFLSFQWLAHSFSLLPLFFASPSFVFNRLQTLSAKHRGYGVPPLLPFTSHQSQITNHPTLCPLCFHGLTNCFSRKPFAFTIICVAPAGVTSASAPACHRERRDEAPGQPMIGFWTPWPASHRA